VLEKTAELLRAGCRTSDIVCRYGGEEFCILLPYTEMDDACAVAEKLRRSVEATHYNDLKVTASIGVSARSLGAEQPQQMIDQADQCLYVAKRRGRNQVIRFDQVDENDLHPQHAPVEAPASVDDAPEATRQRRIPFHAVTALLSALAYRDAATADHSRRVADLCVATAKGLMSVTESYVLEIAALLHDIGKIGVPDSILLKPGRLSEDEWKLMNVYERIGVEIVQSTFDSPELAEIVGTYRAWYGGTPQRPELPTGETIPLGSRILAIADAFNSMTSHRRYRKPMTSQAAFAELRRCAGKQFDGELVERFIAATAAAEQHVADADAALPQAALFGFGYQVERLAESLERQDSQGMAALARRLNMTAAKYEQTEIAALAARLADAADSDAGVEQLVELTHELLDLCRAAQRACLGHRRDESQSTPTERCEN